MSSLKNELDKIALEIAKEIQSAETALDVKLDGFKVLSAYHLGLMKKGEQKQDDDGKPKFADLRNKIAAVTK